MLVYNSIPIFYLVKIYAVLKRPTYLCCCFNGYVVYAGYIKKLFSMHFYTNVALK